MTTRKPKPTPLYAMDAPTQWLQVVTSVVDQDPATVCRKQWQCRQGAVVDAAVIGDAGGRVDAAGIVGAGGVVAPARVTRRVRLH